MLFNIGNYVSRKSYNNDIVFEIVDIIDNTAFLKGINIRLEADSTLDDLVIVNDKNIIDDNDIDNSILRELNLDRKDYFYLPGKILHIDGDSFYLERCMKLYKELNIMAYGVCLKENEIEKKIGKYLKELNPDIVVITGHDSYKKNSDTSDLNSYKNSSNFINAVKTARHYEKDQEKLIIIAGACQSDYEELIKAGATFASSPKRVNIHALDPAIIASLISLHDRNKVIDLKETLSKIKSGSDGFGGIATKGCMFVGYPR